MFFAPNKNSTSFLKEVFHKMDRITTCVKLTTEMRNQLRFIEVVWDFLKSIILTQIAH